MMVMFFFFFFSSTEALGLKILFFYWFIPAKLNCHPPRGSVLLDLEQLALRYLIFVCLLSLDLKFTAK